MPEKVQTVKIEWNKFSKKRKSLNQTQRMDTFRVTDFVIRDLLTSDCLAIDKTETGFYNIEKNFYY